jgi:hypothetical protein
VLPYHCLLPRASSGFNVCNSAQRCNFVTDGTVYLDNVLNGAHPSINSEPVLSFRRNERKFEPLMVSLVEPLNDLNDLNGIHLSSLERLNLEL